MEKAGAKPPAFVLLPFNNGETTMAKNAKKKQTLHMELAETHNRLSIHKVRLEQFDNGVSQAVANHLADTMWFIDSIFTAADELEADLQDPRIDQDDLPF